MRALLLAVVTLVISAAPGVFAQQQFRLFATLIDDKGAPATTVQPGDLKITENSADAKVIKIEPVNWPVKLQLLVDNGIGMGGENLPQLRSGLRALIESMPEGTEITFISTAPQPRTLVKATTDRQMVLQGLDRLSPDSGAGRFVESLAEATQRIEKDTTDYFPVIVSVGTTSGDNSVLDRDVERMMNRLRDRPTTVHVVLLANNNSRSGGANQVNIGLNVTQFTHGKYENINSGSRLATLLPEIGKLVATSYPKEGGKYLVTVERPSGASGELNKVSIATRNGIQATNLSIDSSKRGTGKK